MAAYRRVYDSRYLQADCQEPGSALEPYARQLSMGYLLGFSLIRLHVTLKKSYKVKCSAECPSRCVDGVLISPWVVNSSLVDDPAIQQPGFNLPRRHWALLNRFPTNQGHCASCWKNWGLAATDICPCGKRQTMSHIVNSCPQTKLEGGLQRLHPADDDDTEWLKTQLVNALDNNNRPWASRWINH